MPPAVRITWPPKPTVVQPARFAEVAAMAIRLLANASTELTHRLCHHAEWQSPRDRIIRLVQTAGFQPGEAILQRGRDLAHW